jgi:hypothetical protein
MSYNPVPLFITFAALAAFFGAAFTGYLSVRKDIYKLWLKNIVYGETSEDPNVVLYPAYGLFLSLRGQMTPSDKITFLWTAILMLIIHAGFFLTTVMIFYRTGYRPGNHRGELYRETGFERLFAVWKKYGCCDLKKSPYNEKHEPVSFHKMLEEGMG